MFQRNVILPRLRRVAIHKYFSDSACDKSGKRRGLVLGAFEECGTGTLKLSGTGNKFDLENGNRISELIKGSKIPVGDVRLFNNLGTEFYAVAVAGIGPESNGYNESEVLDECKESIRVGAGVGAQALQDAGVSDIMIEGFSNTEAAAEGSALGVWRYQELKAAEHQKIESTVSLFDDPDLEGWQSGYRKADAQNEARRLEDAPSNVMTPAAFAQDAVNILCPCGVHVDIRDKEWLMEKNMTAFLAMARGSCNPPLFLELSYCGGGESDKPIIITGKGVTFDSGGLSLKRCPGMDEHRADMAGAAVIIGVFKALATLGVPINVNGLIPLMENMPGTMAMKPGDVIVSLNGKTIRIEDTDNEGRVILADALTYGANFKPCLTINVATLTKAARAALGSSATPVFSTSEVVWRELNKAGAETGDRVWRFPAWKLFSDKVTEWSSVDVHNIGAGRGGDPCLAAAFLLEFAPPVDFINMDITGTGMQSSGRPQYIRKGTMSGRPTRTIVQFLNQMACPLDKPTPC